MLNTPTKPQRNEFAKLGARLIRFGQALQEGSTTVGELTSLAAACGISFKLKATAEQGDAQNG
jgi:hypothetical protein